MRYLINEEERTEDFVFIELLAVEKEPPHEKDAKEFYFAYGLMADGRVARALVEYTYYGTGFWVGDWTSALRENILIETLTNQENWHWANEAIGCQDDRKMNHKFMWDMISWFINERDQHEPEIIKPTEETIRADPSPR